MKRPTPDYGFTVIKLFYRKEIDPRNRIDLMVIKWNTSPAPTLEYRRSYYSKKADEWRYRRQAGIGPYELELITKHADEILALLTQPI
jgi:hypothetical protein